MPRKNRKTYDEVMAEINEKEKIAAKKRELRLTRAREQGRKQACEWAELKPEVESRISSMPDYERSHAFNIELQHLRMVQAARERLKEPFLSEEHAAMLVAKQYAEYGSFRDFLITGKVGGRYKDPAEVYLYQTVNRFFRKFGISSSHHLRSKNSSKIEKPLYVQFLAAFPCDTRIEALVLENGMPEVVDMGDKDWAYYDQRICHSKELTTLDDKGFKQYCVSAKERINAIGLRAYYRERNASSFLAYRHHIQPHHLIEASQWGAYSWYVDADDQLLMYASPVWSPSPTTIDYVSAHAKQPLTLCTEKWCREHLGHDGISNHLLPSIGGMTNNRTPCKPASGSEQQLALNF